MFEPHDTVLAKDPNLPFWMTVERVNPNLQIAYCRFGHNGAFAGGFLYNELKHYRVPKSK